MSSQALSSYSSFLPDETTTSALGQQLADHLVTLYSTQMDSDPPSSLTPPSLCIHLSGPLGAGKTALVRALLRALGYAGRVKSPTYALIEPYSVSIKGQILAIYHFDLYRLTSAQEWFELGFRDYLDAGALCLIEWPEQAKPLLPPPDCLLTLKLDAEDAPSAPSLVPSYIDTGSDNTQSINRLAPVAENHASDHYPLFAPTGRWILAQAFSPIGQRYLSGVFNSTHAVL